MRVREDLIGPRVGIRLGEIRDWHTVHGECSKCPHTGRIDVRQLRRKYGEALRLSYIESWLRCTECDNKRKNRLVIYKMDRNV